MRIYREVKIPASSYKLLDHRICDICGQKSRGNEWSSKKYNINETDINITIKQKEGSDCSDGGSGTEYDIDLCPKCFKDRLVPWLISEGAQIDEKEWEW